MAKAFKNLSLGDKVVTQTDIASPSTPGLIKVGSGLVVDENGSLYLKILQDGKLFLPTGEIYNNQPVYRALSLAYSVEQSAAVADISSAAYVWDSPTNQYVQVNS